MGTTLDTDQIAALRALGAVKFNLLLPETKVIMSSLKSDEKLLGVVYGRYRQEQDNIVSRGVLVATDRRVLLINKKPMFMKQDEFAYKVVSGVDYSHVGPMGTLSLHTRMGDIHIRTFNRRCAETFLKAIEATMVRA